MLITVLEMTVERERNRERTKWPNKALEESVEDDVLVMTSPFPNQKLKCDGSPLAPLDPAN